MTNDYHGAFRGTFVVSTELQNLVFGKRGGQRFNQ